MIIPWEWRCAVGSTSACHNFTKHTGHRQTLPEFDSGNAWDLIPKQQDQERVEQMPRKTNISFWLGCESCLRIASPDSNLLQPVSANLEAEVLRRVWHQKKQCRISWSLYLNPVWGSSRAEVHHSIHASMWWACLQLQTTCTSESLRAN